MEDKLTAALLHTLLETYGNDKIYHPDGTTFEVDDLVDKYLRVDPPSGISLTLENYESTFDSVAHELLGELQDPKLTDAYYAFRNLLHKRIKQQYLTTKFSNF